MKVSFKSKIRETFYTDGSLARRYAKVPRITSRHFDINDARMHPKYGQFANWDGFPKMVETAMVKTGGARMAMNGNNERELWVELTAGVPANVTVDDSGFLATITVDIG